MDINNEWLATSPLRKVRAVVIKKKTTAVSDFKQHYKYIKKDTQKKTTITNTCLYNFDPLKPHFYMVKLGFTGAYIFFLFLLKNIDCGYSLEPPQRGGSNENPQSMFWAEIWKISEFFLSINFQFLEVKFSKYLNRRVFIMKANIKKIILLNN